MAPLPCHPADTQLTPRNTAIQSTHRCPLNTCENPAESRRTAQLSQVSTASLQNQNGINGCFMLLC